MGLRQDIIDKIETKFKTILVVNGYHTNLGNNVFVWRPGILQADELPAIVVRDVWDVIDSEGEFGPKNVFTHMMQVESEVVAGGASSDKTVRQMIADVHKAIGVDDTWDGKAVTTILNNGISESGTPADEMNVQQEGNIIAGAKIRFRVLYRTTKWGES
jgi:hypothetical protein